MNEDELARAMIRQHERQCDERMSRIEKMFDDIWRAIDGGRARDREEERAEAQARERVRARHLTTLRWLAGLLFTSVMLLIGYIGRDAAG